MKKIHWRTRAKQLIDEWENNKQSAGRKNRWEIEKREYVKKHGIDDWKFEESRRKELEKMWKSQRDKERYQIEKLKDKLSPMRVKLREWKRKRKKIIKNNWW